MVSGDALGWVSLNFDNVSWDSDVHQVVRREIEHKKYVPATEAVKTHLRTFFMRTQGIEP
jgi:hypothetical protein